MEAGSGALAKLLHLPVRHRGITLGRVTDAGEPGFLPWPSAEPSADEVLVPYPLALLSERELAFYRPSSRSLVAERDAGGASMVAGS